MKQETKSSIRDSRPLPKQHKRSHHNNYHGRCIYMLTLCTEGRIPLLGTLTGNAPENATIVPAPLGEAVLCCWESIPSLQKQFAQKKKERTGQHCHRDISLVACQLMPDHFHGILFVRSCFSDEEARGYMNGCILAARKGAALIGAFISPKEKLVLEVALKEGLPVIYLVPHGFSDYYKPNGNHMEACAQGRMLFLTEASADTNPRKGITREECKALNALAEEMAKAFGATNTSLT